MIKYKHIEMAREMRMWLTGIIVPVAVLIAGVPELRYAVIDKYGKVKSWIKSKVHKTEA